MLKYCSPFAEHDNCTETEVMFNMDCFSYSLAGLVDDISLRAISFYHPLTSRDLLSYSVSLRDHPVKKVVERDQQNRYDFKKLYKKLSAQRRKAVSLLARNGERDMAVLYIIAFAYTKSRPEIFGKKVHLKIFEKEQVITCQRYLFEIN